MSKNFQKSRSETKVPSFIELNNLLFGKSPEMPCVQRWINHGFEFSQNPNFCFLQKYGGPCGVLAALNGTLLKNLFFKNASKIEISPLKDQISIENAFVETITETIIKSTNPDGYFCFFKFLESADFEYFDTDISMEKINTFLTENSQIDQFSCKSSLQKAIQNSLEIFKQKFGILSLIYSILLSRSIRLVRNDMDSTDDTLIRELGYSSQELVNLLLTGKAVSNVFDGDKTLGGEGNSDENEDTFSLKGIKSRSEIGFLTTLESVGHSKVGENYKTPIYPIWVVGSSMHYTLLFSDDCDIVYLTENEIFEKNVKNEFSKIDQFDSGIVDFSMLSIILSKLSLSPSAEMRIGQELRAKRDSDVLLLSELLRATIRHKNNNWQCGHCSSFNSADFHQCNICGNKRIFPVSTIDKIRKTKKINLWHYNALDQKNSGSGDIKKFTVLTDSGLNLKSQGETITSLIKTKWPDCEIDFCGSPENEIVLT